MGACATRTKAGGSTLKMKGANFDARERVPISRPRGYSITGAYTACRPIFGVVKQLPRLCSCLQSRSRSFSSSRTTSIWRRLL